MAISVTNCLNNLKKGLVSAIGIPLESGTLPVLNAASPLGYLSLLPVEFHVSSAMFRILFDWAIHTSKKAALGIINLREFRDFRASASQVYHVSLYMIYSMHPDLLAFSFQFSCLLQCMAPLKFFDFLCTHLPSPPTFLGCNRLRLYSCRLWNMFYVSLWFHCSTSTFRDQSSLLRLNIDLQNTASRSWGHSECLGEPLIVFTEFLRMLIKI